MSTRVAAKKTQRTLLDIRDVELPVVQVIADFDGLLASAKRLDLRTVRRDEVCPGWTGPVLGHRWDDTDFRPGIDQELGSRHGVRDVEKD